MAEHPNPRWEHNFVQQMKRLREARKMTQTDLARELKAYGLPFHQPTVQRIENGERPVRLNEAIVIARVLEADFNGMLTEGTTDQELRFTVDRFRRASLDISEQVAASFVAWQEEMHKLAAAMRPRLETGTHDLDPVTAWGLLWVFKALHADRFFRSTWEGLRLISGRPDKGGTHRLPEEDFIHVMRNWYTEHIEGREDAWLEAPDLVYQEFPVKEV
ncbi:multiprotein-bridging factor 1 family protein [Nonomuraea sp. NPDC003560]|uniref:helix-turn-helix domain-containing protein n=1 Tax=Nonomuraea sp. NPDC003560 TaxID=3364341 RepID=UPI0036A4CC18